MPLSDWGQTAVKRKAERIEAELWKRAKLCNTFVVNLTESGSEI
jgi:hypothetical protein